MANWFSSLFGGGGFGGGGASGKWETGGYGAMYPKVITMPQYSFTEPRLKLTSDFLSENIQNMREGNFPLYYQKAMPMMRESMSRPLHETYYGRTGERQGVLSEAESAGSRSGLGPKSTMANVNKHLRDYATKEKEIDEYLVKMGVNVTSQMATQMPQISAGMPKGPDSLLANAQMVPMGGDNTAAQQGQLAGNLAGLIPQGIDMLGEWWKGRDKGDTQTTPSPTPQLNTQEDYYNPSPFVYNPYGMGTTDFNSTGPTVSMGSSDNFGMTNSNTNNWWDSFR